MYCISGVVAVVKLKIVSITYTFFTKKLATELYLLELFY